jgi:hypothetical protein
MLVTKPSVLNYFLLFFVFNEQINLEKHQIH